MVRIYSDMEQPEVSETPILSPAKRRNQLFAREKFKQGQVKELQFMKDRINEWIAQEERELREIQIEIRESKDSV